MHALRVDMEGSSLVAYGLRTQVVTAAAWVRSLAQEFPQAACEAKGKKKKNRCGGRDIEKILTI